MTIGEGNLRDTLGAGSVYSFSRIATAITAGRQVLVVDQLPSTVRLYAADGSFVRGVGRVGEGPGEYRFVARTWTSSQGAIFLYDPSLRRVTEYGSEGQVVAVRSFAQGAPVRSSGSEGPTILVDRFEDGTFLARPQLGLPADTGRSVSGLRRARVAFLRVDLEHDHVDTLGFFSDVEMFREDSPYGSFWVPAPFGRSTATSVWGNTLLIADNAHFGVDVWSNRGQLLRRFLRTVDLEAVTGERWAQLRAVEIQRQLASIELSSAATDPTAAVSAIESRFQQSPRPDAVPTHDRVLLVDGPGNVWVRGWSDGPTVSPDWHVFEIDEGRYLGVVTVPPQFRPTEIGDDYVLGVWTGELDVESVRLLRLDKP